MATSSIRTRSWALTSITQHQFWRTDYPWSGLGNGQVKDILSTIISDWDTPGNKVVTTSARQSTRQQIIDETWAQLKAHLALAGNDAIKDSDRVHDPFIDPAIKFDGAGQRPGQRGASARQHQELPAAPAPGAHEDSELLRRLRLRADRDGPRVHGGRKRGRAARRECRVAGGELAGASVCIQKLVEPPIFRGFQDIDELEYQTDPSQPPLLCRLLGLLEPTADIRSDSGLREGDASSRCSS